VVTDLQTDEASAQLVAARRASLLQFLMGCLSDARYAQFVQQAKTDAERRQAIRLFMAGAAQSCISSLAKPIRPSLSDMAADAIDTAGGDPMERHDFLSSLEANCLAEKNAPLLRAGREAMTYFLNTGGYDIQWLASILEASLQPNQPDSGSESAPPEPEGPQDVAIMFADIAYVPPSDGGESEGTIAALIEQHKFIVSMAIQRHLGRPVPHPGDSMMAVFPRAADALAGAAAIRRDIADRNELAFDNPLSIRIGLSAGSGDPSDTEYFAILVEMAVRLCATASPGTILLPAALMKLSGSDGFVFSDAFVPPPNVLPDGEAACQLLGVMPPAAAAEPLAIPPAAE
jgi:class 3 adenylate cyclase